MMMRLLTQLMSLAVTGATPSQRVLAEAALVLASGGGGGAGPYACAVEMEARIWGLEAARAGQASTARGPTACITSQAEWPWGAEGGDRKRGQEAQEPT